MNKPAPVPLFNYKKRQRQALVSDPGQLLTSLSANAEQTSPANTNSNNDNAGGRTFSTSGASAAKNYGSFSTKPKQGTTPNKFSSNKPNPGLMDMKGKFSTGWAGQQNSRALTNVTRTNPGPSPTNKQSVGSWGDAKVQGSHNSFQGSRGGLQNRFNQGRGQGLIGNMTHPSRPSSNHQGHGAGGVGSGGVNNRSDTGFCNQDKRLNNMTPYVGQPRPPNSSSCNQFSFKPAPERSSWGSTPAASRGNHGGGGGFSNRANASSGAMRQGPGLGRAGEGSNQTRGRPPQFDSNKTFCRSGGRNQEMEFDFEDSSIFDSDVPKNPPKIQQISNAPLVKPATDTSMRIFTCPISSLKSWVGLKVNAGAVMFEIYGVLDSATVRDLTGTGKEFVLRDDTESIKCVFYEIDRSLPRLTRGQVHRVVGIVDKRLGVLKVVSVRPAEKEERGVCHAASSLSQTEMEVIATQSHEQ